MFCREPEMGAVGPLVEIAEEAAPAVRPQDHVADAEDAAASECARERNRFTSRDDASRRADTPTAAEAWQLQIQTASERMEGSAGREGPVRRERRHGIGVVNHGVASSLGLDRRERKGKGGGTNPEAAVNPRMFRTPATKIGHEAKWLVMKGIF
jgi:hypothetical protein